MMEGEKVTSWRLRGREQSNFEDTKPVEIGSEV
jgi:hypothetical protein